MGRIAAAIWATIGAFGYAATLDTIQSGDEHVQAMRVIAITAAVIAVAVLVIPWTRPQRRAHQCTDSSAPAGR